MKGRRYRSPADWPGHPCREVHLIWDNYATHKTPLIRNWLVKRPRWHVHLTPTSASWLNQVERFFALITERKIRRGFYRSVAALRADIASFIERHNRDPKPFKWTKSADDILSINRALLPPQCPDKRMIKGSELLVHDTSREWDDQSSAAQRNKTKRNIVPGDGR
jgi:DDE superfamily endonuclease